MTALAGVSWWETAAMLVMRIASRQAHRWLRRRVALPGEWATILDLATGETVKRYMLRNGAVTRMQ
jgi:hypothetical protein